MLAMLLFGEHINQGLKCSLLPLTPSAEVLFHALRGKYQLLRPESFPAKTSSQSQQILPTIELIDLKRLRQLREVEWGHTLTPYLLEEIRSTIARGKKVLLPTESSWLRSLCDV